VRDLKKKMGKKKKSVSSQKIKGGEATAGRSWSKGLLNPRGGWQWGPEKNQGKKKNTEP